VHLLLHLRFRPVEYVTYCLLAEKSWLIRFAQYFSGGGGLWEGKTEEIYINAGVLVQQECLSNRNRAPTPR
jgi:hypothetical protein